MALHLRRHPSPATRGQHLAILNLVSPIPFVQETALNHAPGDPLRLLDGLDQGMDVVRSAMLGQHADHEVVAVGGCHTHLDAGFVFLVRLTLALHFRRMQAVQLVLVLFLLGQ